MPPAAWPGTTGSSQLVICLVRHLDQALMTAGAMAMGRRRLTSGTSSSGSLGMWTWRRRLSAGGHPARSQAPSSNRSSSMAAAGRPANSSARQASGPGALPRNCPRARWKSATVGFCHHPSS
eukprot:2500923-Alexandrium_andersonii.AAC.1